MSNYFTPKRRSPELLEYIKENYIISGHLVTRKDGFPGCIGANGYWYHNMPVRIVGNRNCRILAQHNSWFLHTGEWPNYELDHIDSDKRNNAFSNLREVTGKHREEQLDRRKKGLGYCWDNKEQKYRCYIRKAAFRGGKQLHIGYARTIPDAIRKIALAKINLLNDWQEPFADTKSHFPLYTERKCNKLVGQKPKSPKAQKPKSA